MPWASNHVPKYRKHRQSGQAIVTISGRDYLLGPHNSKASKLEYDRLVGEWLVNDRSIPQPDSELSVAELFQKYWRFVRKYYVKGGKPSKEQACIKAAAKPMLNLYGDVPVTEFGPVALKVVRNAMMGQEWSRVTINANVDRIRRAFKWGAAEELVPIEVYQRLATVPGLRRGRTEARECDPIKPIDDATVEATLEHLPQVPADMVRLQRATGMRPAEVCQLRPCDLDRSGNVWTYTPPNHKTMHHGKERTIYIGPKGQAILLRYLARDSKSFCFCPKDSEAKRRAAQHAARKTPISYGNSPGTNRSRAPKRPPTDCYSVDSYRRAIHRACDAAEVPRWSPNRLRHSAATAIRAQFGVEGAQVILGHSEVSTTQVYAEKNSQLAMQIATLIG